MNIKDVKIRDANIKEGSEDLEKVVDLELAFDKEELGRDSSLSEREQKIEQLIEGQESPRTANRAFLAELNGAVKGYIKYSIRGEFALVSSLYVVNEERGKGVGSKLLEMMLKEAKELGAVGVYVTSSISAKPFYERHGFTCFGKDSSLSSKTIFEMGLSLRYA